MKTKSKAFIGLWLVSTLIFSIILTACGNEPVVSYELPTSAAISSQEATPTATAPANTPTSTPVDATASPRPTESRTPSVASGRLTPSVVGNYRFEPTACFDGVLPNGRTQDDDVLCGFLIVPEQHKKPFGKTIKLAVVVLKTSKPNNPTPLFYLNGGPGSMSTNLARQFTTGSSTFAPDLMNERDVVLFDHRGTGHSEPSLSCETEQNALGKLFEGKPSNYTVYAPEYKKAIEQCRSRLVGAGVNLSAYNSVESAADINALAQVLGYNKFDIYGVSYGTRLALTFVRDYPEKVRSLILAGPVPLEEELILSDWTSLERAVKLLFEKCAIDSTCSKYMPRLRSSFVAAYQKLKANPMLLTVRYNDSRRQHKVYLDQDIFISTLYSMLYSSRWLAYIPSMISDILNDDYSSMAVMVSGYRNDEETSSLGLYLSVSCSEEFAFNTRNQAFAKANTIMPELGPYAKDSAQLLFDACEIWNVTKAAPIETKPVVSDKPTLIISGNFDHVTPPNYGTTVAKNLPNSKIVLVPDEAHISGLESSCITNIMRQFLTNPARQLNTACIQQEDEIEFKSIPSSARTQLVKAEPAK